MAVIKCTRFFPSLTIILLLAACSGHTSSSICLAWCSVTLAGLDEINLLDATVISDNEVMVVGEHGRAAHFVRGSWSLVPLPTEHTLYALANNSDRTIAVGGQGSAFEWMGQSWRALPATFVDYDLMHVWVSPAGKIYVIGLARAGTDVPNTTILSFQAGAWRQEWVPDQASDVGDGELVALCGVNEEWVVAVGATGLAPHASIVRYDGVGWHQTVDTDIGLPGACVKSDSSLTIVDREGLDVRQFHADGMRYVDRDCPVTGCEALQSLSIAATLDDQGRLVVVGDAILQERADKLDYVVNPASQELLDVYSVVEEAQKTSVIAVGVGGVIVHYDGENWYSESSGVSATLRATVSTQGYHFAVGEEGTILFKSRKGG